ncbi:nuclear transport factor 2 family protein [Actinocorallia libanotica]|uniref:Nuclear transport factor 2 family protein n=1 Tax=Actinocorallia libanotica TaxID=46162 RepID=A0ABN1RG99_9ACTN
MDNVPEAPGMMPSPALAVAAAAMNAVGAGDRAQWLACFAPDAVVHDPVGGSPLDPEGKGLHGRPALELFWDMAVAPHKVAFEIGAMHPAGDEVAVVASVTTRLNTGIEVRYDGVFTYRVNQAGLISSLKAYWDLQPMLAALNGPGSV